MKTVGWSYLVLKGDFERVEWILDSVPQASRGSQTPWWGSPIEDSNRSKRTSSLWNFSKFYSNRSWPIVRLSIQII